MTPDLAAAIRVQWDRANDAFPDRNEAFRVEAACWWVLVKHEVEVSPEELREALAMTNARST